MARHTRGRQPGDRLFEHTTGLNTRRKGPGVGTFLAAGLAVVLINLAWYAIVILGILFAIKLIFF